MIIEIESGFFKKFHAFLKREKDISIHEDADVYIYDMTETLQRYKKRGLKKLLRSKILPGIAIYKALREHEISADEAKRLIDRYMEEASAEDRMRYRLRGGIARCFGYRTCVYREMKKRNEGWEKIWLVDTPKESRCNVIRCLIASLCAEYECPELTEVFCKDEIWHLKSLHAGGYFSCNRTIGKGDALCDFVFTEKK